MSLTKVTQSMINGSVANVKDYGATGDGSTDDTAAIQLAFDSGNDSVFFPSGTYVLKSSILIPSGSIVVYGQGTQSIIKADPTTTTFNLIDINGNSGPLKTFRDLTFNGPASGVYGTGAAIGGSGNGVHVDNCWFAGIIKGVAINGSYTQVTNSTFEYCYYGIYDVTPTENIFANNVFYKCETDIYVSGTVKSTIISGVSSIGAKTHVVQAVDVVGLVISDISVEDDGTGYNPTIIRIGGTSTHNIVNNVTSKNHGNYLVFLEGPGIDHNIFSNLVGIGLTYGVYVSQGNYNRFSGCDFNSCTNGFRIDTAANNYISDSLTDTCGYGVYLAASTNCRLVELTTIGSTTFGLDTPSTTTVYLNGCVLDSNNAAARGTTVKEIAYP